MQFEFLLPNELKEALTLAGNAGEKGILIGGGTDVIPQFKNRVLNKETVISLQNVNELNFIEETDDAFIIGANYKVADLIKYPFPKALNGFVMAAKQLASPQLREMGTIAGNLSLDTRCTYFNKDSFWRSCLPVCAKVGGNICHAIGNGTKCFAVYSGDLAPALLTLGATITLKSLSGERTIPLREYYTNDGARPIAKQPGEIMTQVHVPKPKANALSDYKKFRLRNSIDFPLASVASLIELDENNQITAMSFALSGVERQPVLVDLGDTTLPCKPSVELAEQVAKLCSKFAKPVKNHVSTPMQRKRMIRSYASDIILELLDGAK